jgi:uncharacterized protein
VRRRHCLGLLAASALLGAIAARAAPIDLLEQDLTLARGEQRLHGSLLRPALAHKPLVALIIAGSGPTDRNGNSAALPGRNDSLALLAQGLAQAGVASLRYDKRGIGASAAAMTAEADLRFEHYADDAAAWVERLAADPRFSGVVIIGHSEGASLGLLAAQRSQARAYVSLAGPGRPAAEVLSSQLQGKLPQALVERNGQILQALQRGETVADIPPALAALYRPSVQPYLISWFRVDPAREIARLSMPVAVIQGTTDIQVSVDDARRLAGARPGSQLHLIAGMNHVLKAVPAEPAQQMASYSDPSQPLAPGLIEALTGFLLGVGR